MIDSIDLGEYYEMADRLIKQIINRETERGYNNYKKLLEKSVMPGDQFFIDQTGRNIRQITMVLASYMLKKVVMILSESEQKVIKDLLKKEGDDHDISRQP